MTMQRGPQRSADIENRKAAELTAAALDCAKQLSLSPADTAVVLGVAQGVLRSMREGKRHVDGVNGEAERADALVRVGKRLKLLLGDAETKWRSWIRREHDVLDSSPLDVMKQRDGVQKIAQLLERSESLDV